MKKCILAILVLSMVFFPVLSSSSSAWARSKHSSATGEKTAKGKKKSAHKGKKAKGEKASSDKTGVGTIGKNDVEFDTKTSK